MKTSRRDFLDPLRNPHGFNAALRHEAQEIQRVERAPVKFSLPRVKEPKKAADARVVGVTSAYDTYLLSENYPDAVPTVNIFGLTSNNTWAFVTSFAEPDDNRSAFAVDGRNGLAVVTLAETFYVSANRNTWASYAQAPPGAEQWRVLRGGVDTWWLSTAASSVYLSTNGGATFTSKLTTADPGSNTDFVVSNTGAAGAIWLDGNDVNVSVSTDNGATWGSTTVATAASTYFTTARLSWVGDRLIATYHTRNGGATQALTTTTQYVAYSDDMGVTWSVPATMFSATGLRYGLLIPGTGASLFFLPTDTPTGATLPPNLYRSQDAGETWAVIESPFSGVSARGAQGMAVASSGNLILLGTNGTGLADECWRLPNAASVSAGNEQWAAISLPSLADANGFYSLAAGGQRYASM